MELGYILLEVFRLRYKLVFIFLIFIGTNVFSQEIDKGSIIGNILFGSSGVLNENYNTGFFYTGFDIDLISKEGVQLTFGQIVNISMEIGVFQNFYLGLGYHYVKNKYHVGGSLVLIPDGNMDGLIGIKANGGYFFTNNLGISANLIYAHAVMNTYMLLTGGVGLTIRL
jgi:hypothetical protein